MAESGTGGRRWLKFGCLTAAVGIGLLATAVGFVTGVALLQMRAAAPEVRQLVREIPDAPASPPGSRPTPRAPGWIEIDVSVAQLIVVPAPAGEPIAVEANYDPRYYELTQESDDLPDGGWGYRVGLAPRGASLMALFRVKLGATPPMVRLALPRDVQLTLDGRVRGSFAAMELGGLRLDTVEMNVRGGAVAVSFEEPLSEPMDRLAVLGDRGSVEVTGLGNASPRTAVLGQHLGELDLDLRGAWLRDAEIRVDAIVAGGSVWLPHDVVVEGVEERITREPPAGSEELALPHLKLSVNRAAGRLVFVD